MTFLPIGYFALSGIVIFSGRTRIAANKDLRVMEEKVSSTVRVFHSLCRFDHITLFCSRLKWRKIGKAADNVFQIALVKYAENRKSSLFENSSKDENTEIILSWEVEHHYEVEEV